MRRFTKRGLDHGLGVGGGVDEEQASQITRGHPVPNFGCLKDTLLQFLGVLINFS